jgi:hypothetical protein
VLSTGGVETGTGTKCTFVGTVGGAGSRQRSPVLAL